MWDGSNIVAKMSDELYSLQGITNRVGQYWNDVVSEKIQTDSFAQLTSASVNATNEFNTISDNIHGLLMDMRMRVYR